MRNWVRTLPPGARVVDLGCGSGFPITEVLVAEGLDVYAVDAAPSFCMPSNVISQTSLLLAKPSNTRRSSI